MKKIFTKRIFIGITLLSIITLSSLIILNVTRSIKLENDSRVDFNSELIYYLDVTYDGVDKHGVESNDNIRSSVMSDYIYVEDKLPDGLIFNGFVIPEGDLFEAISRDGSNSVCSGTIDGDYAEERSTRTFTWMSGNNPLHIVTTLWGNFIYANEIGYNPTKPGYVFEGWSEPTYDENLNVIYNAVFRVSKEISYTISWYDSETGEYIAGTEKRIGAENMEVVPTIADKEKGKSIGYVFDESNPNNITSVILSEDKSNEIKLYFKKASETSQDTTVVNGEEPANEGYTYSFRGLHYNEKTRTISFKVKNLQAGCKIRIGIKTITPSTVDNPATEQVELRRDFYNFASSEERNNTKISNQVHAWMGEENENTYKVSYAYIGEIPENAPALPSDATYSENSTVYTALEPRMSGYIFSGWSSDNVEIENGSFKMPNQNVTFVGSWKKATPYKITYNIEGELPPNYVPPSEKEYYEGDIVKLDILKKGDIFDGYRFLGWSRENKEINDETEFVMPANDVVFTGKFEEVKYKVEYQFISSILPDNAESLLPQTQYYSPGEIVNLATIEDVSGYHFLGWYRNDSFEMPAQDVLITGEWKERRGVFTPQITKEIINYQDYYRTGDVVSYRITVENNEDYAIKNVLISENNEKASFTPCFFGQMNQGHIMCKSGFTDYELITDRMIRIETLNAHTSVIFTASYKVADEDIGTIENEVEIIGASAENNYDLDESKEYKSKTSFKVQSKISICKEVLNTTKEKDFQFHITNNNNQDIWLNIEGGTCQSIYVEPSSYELQEVVPQEYTLEEISIFDGTEEININNGETINIKEGKNYTITFINKYQRKGFFHSDGKAVNDIQNIVTVTWVDWDGNTIKSEEILEEDLKNINSMHPAPLEDYHYEIEGINGDYCTIDCPFTGWSLRSVGFNEYIFGPVECAMSCMM